MADTKRALAPGWAMNTRSIFLKRLGLLMEYIGASGELECEIGVWGGEDKMNYFGWR